MCFKVSEGNEFWMDLYQEFILTILDDKNKELILKAENIEAYSYTIIRKLWSQKNIRKHTRKSSLNQLTEDYDGLDEYFELLKINQPSETEAEIRRKLKFELTKLINSEDKKSKRQGELLKRFCDGENRLQISKSLKINYKIVYEEINKAIIKIKSSMGNKNIPATKTEIQITLRNEGCKASYSGKTKTFYVDRMPVPFIVKEVESSGFKVEKK